MNNIKAYRIFFVQYVKSLLSHKADFLLNVLTILLNQTMSLLFLYIIHTTVPSLKGWNTEELLLIYSIFLFNKGLSGFLTNGLYSIENLIKRGELDRYLIRPVSPLVQIIMSSVDITQIVNIIVGVGLFIYILPATSVILNFQSILVLMLFTFISLLLFFSIKLMTMSIAFWTLTSFPVTIAAENMSDFSKYPINIFPNEIRYILIFIIPWAFISYYPTAIILGRVTNYLYILLASVISCIFLMLSIYVWNKGLKHYGSAGN